MNPSDKKMAMNLFLSILSCHNMFSHDKNIITFTNDDGASFKINASVNLLEVKTPIGESWTENISIGEMHTRLLPFIQNEYRRLFDEYKWLDVKYV